MKSETCCVGSFNSIWQAYGEVWSRVTMETSAGEVKEKRKKINRDRERDS